jgi:UDP-N-acetylmuramoyl-tripeptide--D-alanyl-D-alanine ligase
MMKPRFTVREIAAAVNGHVSGSENTEVCGVSTDSRTIEPGELFIPLRGERFDGHEYIHAAFQRGVRVFLAARDQAAAIELSPESTCITVPDTLRALGDLAAFHRSRFSLPVIGITGSNGKTTTKEMLASILSRTGDGLKTSGNLNNLVGLPRMLLQLRGAHRWAVLEMGMSEPGEIDRLAEIARPDVGVITNASPAHLLSMGSVAAVASAKGELLMRLSDGGSAVLNADDPLVADLPSPAGVRRILFGFGAVVIGAEEIRELGRDGQEFILSLPSGSFPVRMKVFGRHNISNALAAAAAAHAIGVAPADILAGLESFTPFEKRFAPEELDGVLLVDDSYNANPASMRAALVTVRHLKDRGRGIAVLGDMLELGESSAELHEQIGRLAADSVERLYLLGEMADAVARGARAGGLPASSILVAECHAEIVDDALRFLSAGDCILVKGSRGMRMETVAEGIRSAFRSGMAKGDVN